MNGKRAKTIRKAADFITGKRVEQGEDIPVRSYNTWHPPKYVRGIKVQKGKPAQLGDCKRRLIQEFKDPKRYDRRMRN